MYKYIEPEVAGELGEDTIVDSNFHLAIIDKLHYELEGWLGKIQHPNVFGRRHCIPEV